MREGEGRRVFDTGDGGRGLSRKLASWGIAVKGRGGDDQATIGQLSRCGAKECGPG